MTQQIINLGTGPDSQTGDTLYVAFTKVNENFSEVYSVFGANEVTTFTANTVTANTVFVKNNATILGNLSVSGNIETIANVVGAAFYYSNGVPVFSALYSNITSNLLPNTANTYSLGSNSITWRSGYFASNVVINGASISVSGGQLYINGVAALGLNTI